MSVESWESKTLRSMLKSLESGSRPQGGVSGVNEGVPSIGAEHLSSDGGFCFDRIKFIPPDFASRLKRGRVEEGDVLIVKDGATTGKVSYVDNHYPFAESYVNEHVFICRPSDTILSKYLYYFLRSKEGNAQIMATFHGAAQGGISSGFADEVSVPKPKMEEQLQIVEKLDAILPRVRQVKARLEKITMLKSTFMSSMASEMSDENVSYKLGEYVAECVEPIGNEWQSFPRIGVNKNSGIEELRSSKQTGFERYKIVRKGYIVYNPMRVNIGSIALYDKEQISITSPDYVVFKPRPGIPSIAIYSFLKSPKGLRQINNNTQGAVRERLYFQNLCNVDIGKSIIDNAIKYQPVLEWFHVFSDVERRIGSKLDKAEQAILAKAFRGEL